MNKSAAQQLCHVDGRERINTSMLQTILVYRAATLSKQQKQILDIISRRFSDGRDLDSAMGARRTQCSRYMFSMFTVRLYAYLLYILTYYANKYEDHETATNILK